MNSPRRWRQAALITIGFAALYGAIRILPEGRRLTHLDFLVTGSGGIQFCDATDPRFLPVVTARSPVVMSVEATGPAEAARGVRAEMTLRTASGKPIGPDELETVEGRKIQLLIVDPALREMHQEEPRPGDKRGDWRFAFTPGAGGIYRVFADFKPQAIDREMYVWADLPIAPGAGKPIPKASGPQASMWFALRPSSRAIAARQPVAFTVAWIDGTPLTVDPYDGAWGRLTIIDQDRRGLAYLHPPAPRGTVLPAPVFKVTLSNPGAYVAWATIVWRGRAFNVPLRFSVQP